MAVSLREQQQLVPTLHQRLSSIEGFRFAETLAVSLCHVAHHQDTALQAKGILAHSPG